MHAWKGLLWRAAGADAATAKTFFSFQAAARTNLCAALTRLEGNKGMQDSVHCFQAMPLNSANPVPCHHKTLGMVSISTHA